MVYSVVVFNDVHSRVLTIFFPPLLYAGQEASYAYFEGSNSSPWHIWKPNELVFIEIYLFCVYLLSLIYGYLKMK